MEDNIQRNRVAIRRSPAVQEALLQAQRHCFGNAFSPSVPALHGAHAVPIRQLFSMRCLGLKAAASLGANCLEFDGKDASFDSLENLVSCFTDLATDGATVCYDSSLAAGKQKMFSRQKIPRDGAVW